MDQIVHTYLHWHNRIICLFLLDWIAFLSISKANEQFTYKMSRNHKLYSPSMKILLLSKYTEIKENSAKSKWTKRKKEKNGCSFIFSVIMIFMIVLENTENKFLGTKWVKLLIRYCNCTRLEIFFFISSIIYHCASFIL